MLARFFEKSQPISFVSLLFILLFFVIISFCSSLSHSFDFSSILQIIGVFIFFVFFVFLGSFIIQKNRLTPLNYFAIFSFVLLFGLFPEVLIVSKISLSHLFVLLASRRLYSIYSKKDLLLKLFDSGFYIGIAYLFYPQSILYLFLIYISYFIYLKVINKNLFLPILGFLTPVFIVFTYYFITDNLTVFHSLTELNIHFKIVKISTFNFLIPFFLIVIMLVSAVILMFILRKSFEGKDKNSTKIIIAHLLISIVLLFINNLRVEETIQFIFFPTAVIMGNLLSLIRSYWLKNLLLYFLLVLVFSLPIVYSYM